METIALSKPNFGAELDDIFALHKKLAVIVVWCGMVWYHHTTHTITLGIRRVKAQPSYTTIVDALCAVCMFRFRLSLSIINHRSIQIPDVYVVSIQQQPNAHQSLC